VTHDHCDAQALLFKRGTVSREPLQALPCRMVSRGCLEPVASMVYNNGIWQLATSGISAEDGRLVGRRCVHTLRRQLRRRTGVGWRRGRPFPTDLPSAGSTPDRLPHCPRPARSCCSSDPQYRECSQVDGRTNSHPLKTRLRTARTNAASISLQHDCLRTTRSPPHSSQYGGEPAACKESCNSTPTMIVRVCLLPAPVGKARRSESPGAAVSARLFASIP